jgi:hypothetical protein
VASGAGLNRVGARGGVPFFNFNPNIPYGPVSMVTGNGPFDSGIQMLEGVGFGKWTFQLIGTFTGYSVTVYGTIDPIILTTAYQNSTNLNVPTLALNALRGNTTLVPATSWFPLAAPSDQGGTGQNTNPLIQTGSYLFSSGNFVAVRAVITGTTATGSINVLGFATP